MDLVAYRRRMAIKLSSPVEKWPINKYKHQDDTTSHSLSLLLCCVTDVTNTTNMAGKIPSIAEQAVLVKSTAIPDTTPIVKGFEWTDGPVDYEKLLDSYLNSGFQATNFGNAVLEVRKMVNFQWKSVYKRLTLRSFCSWIADEYHWAQRTPIHMKTMNLFEENPIAPFSWATLPTWSPPGWERLFGTWCSTGWLTV